MASATAAAVAFVGVMAAGPSVTIDAHKAPRALVAATRLATDDTEASVACLGWFQPSLVFYARRDVQKLQDLEGAKAFLAQSRPASVRSGRRGNRSRRRSPRRTSRWRGASNSTGAPTWSWCGILRRGCESAPGDTLTGPPEDLERGNGPETRKRSLAWCS